MILRQISVSNWRSLLKSVELGPFSEGLNVIHAPNGTGKSSLFEAMQRGLFDAHHTSGADIKAVLPWGRKLTPSVIIEFIEGGETWRVEKKFLSEASAKLQRFEDGEFKPFANGRGADSEIRKILSAEGPRHGPSKPEHWGLAQILWAPQGELNLKKISGSTAEVIKGALGVQLSGGSGGLQERIKKRLLEYFTEKGKEKTGKNAPPIVDRRDRQSALKKELEERQERYQAFEEQSKAVEDAAREHHQKAEEAAEMRKKVKTARTEEEKFNDLKTEQKIKRQEEKLAKNNYERLTQIKKTREAIAALKKTITSKEGKLAELEEKADQAKDDLDRCSEARDSACEKRSQIDERQKVIDAAREYLRQTEDLKKLKKRLSDLVKFENQLTADQRSRNEIVAPTSDELRDLRESTSKLKEARAALEASQIHLAITPEREIVIENTIDDSETPVKAGKTSSFSGDGQVNLKVAGFGLIHASGPKDGADRHRADLKEAQERISELSQPYGTEKPDELQELKEKADKLDGSIRTLDGKIETLLGEDSSDSLKQYLDKLRTAIGETENVHPEWKKEPPVLDELESDFETFRQDTEGAIAAAEDAFNQAHSESSEATNAANNAAVELEHKQEKLKEQQDQLEKFQSDGLSDEDRDKAISEASMSWQAAKETADQAEKALKQFPGDPTTKLKELEKQRDKLDDAEQDARDKEKTAEGELRNLESEGAYSKLVDVEEELEALESQIEWESIQMDAIKLLHETVNDCEKSMIESVLEPVELRASELWARVAGSHLGDVKLKGDFAPKAVTPERADGPVGLGNLSGGEEEQLYFIVRLALAKVLAENERQLVVLDDVLNATDAERLGCLLNLLKEVSDRLLQVIIFTCHPERYRALDLAESNFFELKSRDD
ncbi:MAG: Chromosome partition protein Smc [Verrucomicrobia subdivision 3 bacterium]|nr:Chromosome partition protein Smc [Limisphaerales bacterium]MCS1413676.1 Chromosome partition protein Smc [Limisphaerales bacterium]